MALRPATLINDFAGGTPGQTVTPANSGGTSGQSFDTGAVTAGAGTFAYDVTQVPPGQSVACKVATAGAGTAYAGWSTSLTSPNGGSPLAQVWFRCYLYVPAALTANTTVFGAFQSGGGTCGTVKLTTAGTVTFSDSTGTAQVTIAAFPTSAWFRLEGFIAGDPVAGQLNLALYSSPDSTTPSSAPATATGLNTLGTMTGWRFGQATSLTGAGPYWLGSPGLSNAGPLGPTPLGFTAVRDDDGGCITQVAVAATGGTGTGTPGLVGNTSTAGLYAGATTRQFSANDADAATGRVMAYATQKIFYQAGNFPQALHDGAGLDVTPLVKAGCQFWLCYQPASDGSDRLAMQQSLQYWQGQCTTLGAPPPKAVIFSEPQNFAQFTGQPVPATA